MHCYTTLFDSFYLSRGLIMYRSLEKCTKDFHLYIFAFDNVAFEVLNSLSLKNTTVISLEEFENDELREVKKTRTKAEYCWTCTSSVIKHVLDTYKVPECTYVDSDLFFFSDPSILISELDSNKKNVLITEHRYSLLPRLYEEKRSGRFCVQFMTFRNEEDSLNVLDVWRKQCIDWCYARHEDGKFGDQKYLDEWPARYNNVHILQNPGGGLAPWNLRLFSFKKRKDLLWKERATGKYFDPVFYHFQYVKPMNNRVFDIGWYPIPTLIKNEIYLPYLIEIERTEEELQKDFRQYTVKYHDLNSYYSGNFKKNLLKKTLKFNILQLP